MSAERLKQTMEYPDTFYARDAGVHPEERVSSSPGELPARCDCVVVGAGFAGLTTALEMARQGRDVVLLESRRAGWGASGRNGGFVSAGFALGLDDLVSRLGPEHAGELFSLSREGVGYVRQQAVAIDPAIIQGRGWIVARRYSDPGGVRRTCDLFASYGLQARAISRDRMRHLLASETYFEGVEDPEAFHIQPLLYALGLAARARAAGVRIFQGHEARELRRQGENWQVRVNERIVVAPHVVLTGSAYMGRLYPPLSRAILPVATYVVATRPMADRLERAIPYAGCISDNRRAGDYYRRLPDGRLLWGGRITTRKSQPRALSRMLKRDIIRIYPSLADLEITHAWSGLMGYARHKMPIVGELEPGLWSATAFGGHGLNTTAMGANLISSAICNGDDRWRLFAPFGPAWAGGALGRAATQGVYWLMQMQDRIEEKRNRKGA